MDIHLQIHSMWTGIAEYCNKKEYSYFHTKVVIIDHDFVKLLFSKTDKVTNIEHVTMQEDNEYLLYLSSYSLS